MDSLSPIDSALCENITGCLPGVLSKEELVAATVISDYMDDSEPDSLDDVIEDIKDDILAIHQDEGNFDVDAAIVAAETFIARMEELGTPDLDADETGPGDCDG